MWTVRASVCECAQSRGETAEREMAGASHKHGDDDDDDGNHSGGETPSHDLFKCFCRVSCVGELHESSLNLLFFALRNRL